MQTLNINGMIILKLKWVFILVFIIILSVLKIENCHIINRLLSEMTYR
jgi:hypothetical protein